MKLSEAVRGKLAIMRARAKLGGSKKKGGGGKKKSNSGGRGWFGGANALGGSLFELGSVAVLGGVTIGSVFRLPAWLSPIGFAFWLYGMWRGNGTIKALGILLIALGFIDTLGIPRAIAGKVQEAKAKGLIPMLSPSPAAQTTTTEGGGARTERTSQIEGIVDDVVAGAEGYGRVRAALA